MIGGPEVGGVALVEAGLAALLPVVVAVVLVVVFRRRRRDEIYVEVTPGEVPRLGDGARVARTERSSYAGPVAVRFTPPDGLRPGLAGTVVDGRVDTRDLTASLVDLSIRGHVDITPEGDDWRLTRTTPPVETDAAQPAQPLDGFEVAVLAAFFGDQPSVPSTLKRPEFVATLHAAEVELYREVVANGWYLRHPRSRNSRIRLAGILLLVASLALAVVAVLRWDGGREALWVPALAASGVVASLLMVRLGRGRTPRTALGTAAMVQSLGFQKYLGAAEAHRLRWEEAAATFTAYLPYAVAFGVAGHWTSVVGEVLRSAQLRLAAENATEVALEAAFNSPELLLDTMSGLGNLADLVPGELPDVDLPGLDLPDLLDLDLDLGAAFSGLGDAVGSLTEGIGDLLPGDGCLDGCDGCDALGCLDF